MSESYQKINIKFDAFSKTEQFYKALNKAFESFESDLVDEDESIATDKAIAILLTEISKAPLNIHLKKSDVICSYEAFLMEYSGDVKGDELEFSFINGEWFWEKMLPLMLEKNITYVFSTVDVTYDDISAFALVNEKLIPIYQIYSELGMDDEIMEADNRHQFMKELFDSGKIGLVTHEIFSRD
jgi:hypothetical protein